MSRSGNNLIWDYFQRNQDNKIAECNICKKNISYKTTITNLKQHIKLKHIGIFNEFISRSLALSGNRLAQGAASSSTQNDRQGNAQSGVDTNVGGGEITNTVGSSREGVVDLVDPAQSIRPPRQRTMASYLPRHLRQDERKKIDKALLKLMTVDFQPFSIVEDEGFKEFVSVLNPCYELPNRKTILNFLLSAEYNERHAEIQTLVRQRSISICITVDCWTSKNMESYMAVTGHFIDKETLQFRSILIQCAALEGHHTGERLATELRQIFNEWDIYGKINFIVSDNAANMIAAARTLVIPHFGCFAHKLNLIVQAALADEVLSRTVTKVQRTVSHFKRSTIAKERLQKYQQTAQNIAQPKSLLLSVPTRWNSTYQMLERFNALQEALRATIPNLNTELPVIPMEEWKCINQMCEVLKPFEDVTKIMSSETYLSASKAIVLLAGINTVCDQLLQRNFFDIVNILIFNLKRGLFERFGQIEENEPIAICTLLDPRFKHHAFEDQAAMLAAKTKLLQKISSLHTEDIIEPGIGTGASGLDSLPSTSLWGKFDNKVLSSRQPKTAEEKATDEINMYWRETVLPRTECPIKWWKEHKTIYPTLYQTFISCSNIVVTSVPCERVFSRAGYMISERRTRLTTSKVKQLMFLNALK